MARPRGKSFTQQYHHHPQEEELPNLNAQVEYINNLLKWSIQDLDHLIGVLRQRIAAEDAYANALDKIERLPRTPFFNEQTMYETAVAQYEISLNRTVAGRRELLKAMKLQLQSLNTLRDYQEQRRKKIKSIMLDKNAKYMAARTGDFSKRQRQYLNKCTELDAAQHDEHQQAEQQTLQQQQQEDSDHSSGGGSDVPHNKRTMAGFMALKTQLANVMSSTHDYGTRASRLKRDMLDADREYRRSVADLERLRKKQVDTANHAVKHVEVLFLDKSEICKSALYNILTVEQVIQANESSLVKAMFQTAAEMDGKKDMEFFKREYSKLKFDTPEPIMYDNHYHGRLKDMQFGVALDVYAKLHTTRRVPVLVERCIQAIEEMGGLEKEGLYRVSGRQSSIEQLKLEFERDENKAQIQSFDIFTIASVLKIYLRELEVPLFPLQMRFRAEYSAKDDATRLRELESRLQQLSDPHRCTLKAVVEHLAKVNSKARMNKMNMQNLEVIFTPAIFHDHNQAEVPGEWCSDKVLPDLIFNHERLFSRVNDNKDEKTAADSNDMAWQQQRQQSNISTDSTKPSTSLPVTVERSDSRGKRILARKDSLNALQRPLHQRQGSTRTTSSLRDTEPDTPEPSSPPISSRHRHQLSISDSLAKS